MARLIGITSRLLTLLILLLWVRSYWRYDSLLLPYSVHYPFLISSGGRISLTANVWENRNVPDPPRRLRSWSRQLLRPEWEWAAEIRGRRRFWGFEWSPSVYFHHHTGVPEPTGMGLTPKVLAGVPYWSVAAAAATPAVWGVARARRRRRRAAAGSCPTCGYDVRATRERCPECGGSISDTAPETAA